MDRRTFTAAVGGALLAWMRVANAQQAGRVWRVGFLTAGARPPEGSVPAPLREGLQARGYLEGRDVAYEGRWAQGRSEALPGLAAELVALKVDLIVALGGAAAEAAKQTTSTLPIVVLSAGDVVETGLVASLARPGGNITGVNDPARELSAKRLQILKELVPAAGRVAVLWNAGNYAMTLRYREIEKAASVLGMTVEPLGVREPDDFDGALAAMNRVRPDALMMVTDALTNLNRRRVLDYVAARRIPAMYEYAFVVRDGGLISYGSEQSESLTLAADAAARVLRGAKPGELPVAQPSRYLLVINLKTARSLGLAVPQSLLQRADEVMQ